MYKDQHSFLYLASRTYLQSGSFNSAQWVVQFQIDQVNHGKYFSGAFCTGRTISSFAGIFSHGVYYLESNVHIMHVNHFVLCSNCPYRSIRSRIYCLDILRQKCCRYPDMVS